jgi:hypothetical protein
VRRRLIVRQSPPHLPTYWRQKSTGHFPDFVFTRRGLLFSVVALKLFSGSGTKLSQLLIAPCIKGETGRAISMKVVPSFSIFQEISRLAMGGLELCPNA